MHDALSSNESRVVNFFLLKYFIKIKDLKTDPSSFTKVSQTYFYGCFINNSLPSKLNPPLTRLPFFLLSLTK